MLSRGMRLKSRLMIGLRLMAMYRLITTLFWPMRTLPTSSVCQATDLNSVVITPS